MGMSSKLDTTHAGEHTNRTRAFNHLRQAITAVNLPTPDHSTALCFNRDKLSNEGARNIRDPTFSTLNQLSL
ncbi:hypothetical protein XFF6166_380018 [Xanthomonas citri pv. fuscans]|uniref:Uncharacterized protein n=1 Tax=Xanthomonas campestris pv. phaseoli TaxID=317013 RepID=A0A7Z7NGX8_XANCH|nr:hypothetical protein XAC3824_580061 [Xanthomonas citri pv. citri]CEJ44898.1 hypothetical protein XAB3213_2870022 [Xanthomonas citri pv. bilvae]SON79180.1 hypothetical protein XFF6166_380018 [Xanthomonas citri pv. fuscans]SOO23535.1 hypothetical protein XFF6991_280194 [Xanthomonas phaseoli pv. phaseoli]CEE42247.1 hypothetical protein XAC902_620061 [Xanthomonas citri pv. citri]